MNNSFYRAFEERYRGSRELILQRLRVYATLTEPLTELYQPASALDLGCGRGEWLELLGEAGFDASGVDLDDSMLIACHERGLRATRADALATLHALPDDSLTLVSAFHLVEHIPFDDVRALIAESLRVLKPGGILIMETPNPENLVVGTSDFYNDPSHLRPIPPKLLLFATEHAGFARQLVMRLQEAPALPGAAAVSLYNVLAGASPDFSVVAQKGAPGMDLSAFDPGFAGTYGIDVHNLAQRYDIGQDERIVETRAQLAQLSDRSEHETARVGHEASQALLGMRQLQMEHQQLSEQVQRMDQASDELAQRMVAVQSDRQAGMAALLEEQQKQLAAVAAENDAVFLRRLEAHLAVERQDRDRALADASAIAEEQARVLARQLMTLQDQNAHSEALIRLVVARLATVDEHTTGLHARVEQAEALAAHMSERMLDLLASRSWRLTSPLRVIGGALRRRGDRRAGPHGLAPQLVGGVLRRLRFRHAGSIVQRFPWLHRQLYRVMFQADDLARLAAAQPEPEQEVQPDMPPAEVLPTGVDLSPRALAIYRRLKRLPRNGN